MDLLGADFGWHRAFHLGGRWNSRGSRILYTTGSLSHAALEMPVHLNDEELLLAYSFAAVEFDEKFILPVEDFTVLPDDWSASPPPLAIQKIGDDRVKSNASVVLRVPTLILPVESNYLINVCHTDFSKIMLGETQRFTFDKRLYEK